MEKKKRKSPAKKQAVNGPFEDMQARENIEKMSHDVNGLYEQVERLRNKVNAPVMNAEKNPLDIKFSVTNGGRIEASVSGTEKAFFGTVGKMAEALHVDKGGNSELNKMAMDVIGTIQQLVPQILKR